jgi:hypothetical protein
MNGGLAYTMAKSILYQYLYELNKSGTDIKVILSGIGNDGISAGWIIDVDGEADGIDSVIRKSRVRPGGHLIRNGGSGHIITVDRYSTADVVAALFDQLATTGEWTKI